MLGGAPPGLDTRTVALRELSEPSPDMRSSVEKRCPAGHSLTAVVSCCPGVAHRPRAIRGPRFQMVRHESTWPRSLGPGRRCGSGGPDQPGSPSYSMVSMLAPSGRIRLLVGHRSAPPGSGLQGIHVHHTRVAAVDVISDRELPAGPLGIRTFPCSTRNAPVSLASASRTVTTHWVPFSWNPSS
jgi:hypothetical protein